MKIIAIPVITIIFSAFKLNADESTYAQIVEELKKLNSTSETLAFLNFVRKQDLFKDLVWIRSCEKNEDYTKLAERINDIYNNLLNFSKNSDFEKFEKLLQSVADRELEQSKIVKLYDHFKSLLSVETDLIFESLDGWLAFIKFDAAGLDNNLNPKMLLPVFVDSLDSPKPFKQTSLDININRYPSAYILSLYVGDEEIYNTVLSIISKNFCEKKSTTLDHVLDNNLE